MPELSSAETAERTLIITRTFDAPIDLVWKAWADPDQMVRWMGPEGFNGKILKMDTRPGGSFRFHMRGPDGDHWMQGVYREIVERERLVYTFTWGDAEGKPTRPETLITVTFAARGAKTELTFHQAVFESVNARDMHRGGWSSSFNKLARQLASMQA